MVLVMDPLTQVETQGTPSVGTVYQPGPRIPLTWLLLSLAVAALVALVTLSLVIGKGLSDRVNDLEREIPRLTDRLASEDSQLVDALLQLRVISFWLAYPTNDPMLLEPPSGNGNTQGVLRIADDGLSAILLVADMPELPPASVYQVWLTGEGQRVRVGQLQVDPRGWGATTIYLEAPIFGFEAVDVTAETEGGLGLASGVRVLEGKIVSETDSG